jgi:hypothetical protein
METHVLFFPTISYFIHCIIIARSKVVLSERRFGGNGMSCVFFQELSKTGGLHFIPMFDETIILQRSLENSYALPNIDELLCDFSNSTRCLLSTANSLFTQLLCLAVLQCCCTVQRFAAMTFTSQNLQNKIFLSVVKYFSPNSLTKLRNLTLSEHFTLGILKVETVLRYSI